MIFKKLCTKVESLEKCGDAWNEETTYIVGRIPKSKLTGFGVIQSVSYVKCDVTIPDDVVNKNAVISEINEQ